MPVCHCEHRAALMLVGAEASPAAASGRPRPAAPAPGRPQPFAISGGSSRNRGGCSGLCGGGSGSAGSQASQAASRASRTSAGARCPCDHAPAGAGASRGCVVIPREGGSAAGRCAADAVHDLAAHRQDVPERAAGGGAAGPAARAEHLQRVGADQRGAPCCSPIAESLVCAHIRVPPHQLRT